MKLLLNVFIPAIDENYDMFIPDNLTIGEIVPLVSDIVNELSNGRFSLTGEEIFCYAEKSIPLNDSITPKDINMKHGDHLILI